MVSLLIFSFDISLVFVYLFSMFISSYKLIEYTRLHDWFLYSKSQRTFNDSYYLLLFAFHTDGRCSRFQVKSVYSRQSTSWLYAFQSNSFGLLEKNTNLYFHLLIQFATSVWLHFPLCPYILPTTFRIRLTLFSSTRSLIKFLFFLKISLFRRKESKICHSSGPSRKYSFHQNFVYS